MAVAERYLIMVDPKGNHNKFYKMINMGEGQWKAEYGRVGSGVQSRIYPESEYEKKLNEKLRKGYRDMTELHLTENRATVPTFSDITDQKVAALVAKLMNFAKNTIRSHYLVSASDVSPAMIQEARHDIARLRTYTRDEDVDAFNRVLTDLMHVIPRRIDGKNQSGVQRMMASEALNFGKIILREEELLDVMEGQVNVSTQNLQPTDAPQTLLDALGVEIYVATEKQENEVRNHLSDRLKPCLRGVYRVINKKTQGRFDEYLKAKQEEDGEKPVVKMFWHGSRNANWVSILQNGLLLRPNAIITGKMFGDGIYFAPSAMKSWGYTSSRGAIYTGDCSDTAFMALYATAYGHPYEVRSHDDSWHGYNYDRLQKEHAGCDCVHAKATKGMLLNDEIIFYRQDQMTITYLCEFAAM